MALPVVGGDDPIIAPPLYGHWHALIDRLDPALAPTSWFHRLNTDPRYRAAAGLGARVVRKNQEAYMREAWRQIGDVLRANETINRTQLGMLASEASYAKSIVALPSGAGGRRHRPGLRPRPWRARPRSATSRARVGWATPRSPAPSGSSPARAGWWRGARSATGVAVRRSHR